MAHLFDFFVFILLMKLLLLIVGTAYITYLPPGGWDGKVACNAET